MPFDDSIISFYQRKSIKPCPDGEWQRNHPDFITTNPVGFWKFYQINSIETNPPNGL